MPRPKKTTTAASKVPAKTAKVAKAAVTRTKADVNAAFEEVKRDVLTSESVDDKVAELLKVQEEAVEKTAAGMSVEKTVKDLASVGLSAKRALDQVTESMTEAIGGLQSVSNAVELKRKELLALHEVDVAATSVRDLVEEYEIKSSEFSDAILDTREAWKKEQADYAKIIIERNQELDKARKREHDDYDYKVSRDRKMAQDKFEEGLTRRAKDVKEKEEGLLRDWSRREDELKVQEADLASFKQQVADMPDVIKKEAAKAEAIVRNSVTKEFGNKVALSESNFAADKRVLELQVTTMQANLTDKDRTIAELQAQLKASQERVQKIASDAFESVSGKQALSVATQMSREAAQGPSKK
jgi:hypothetical protein